jgi:glycosyltransferase involved in cell wall biosynthesis
MTKGKLHILILTPGFPKDENDFNCIPPLQDFLAKFSQTYSLAKISVIAFQYPYNQNEYLWNGIEIISLKGKNSKIKKPLVWLNAYFKAIRINNSDKIDVIHSLWLGECAMLGNIISKKINCPHICTLMGQDVKISNRYLRWLKISKIKFIALSENQAEMFSELTNRKVDKIIYWGIEDQNFENTRRDIDLLAVGSLIPLKNYSLFIRLIAELKFTYPNLKCKLVGTGPELSTLMNLASEKVIRENIEFTGLLSRQEIFKLMQRSKIFIHPSHFEGSGFVFAEALVNGMNILSYNVGYAQNHPKWFIAKDELEFIQLTKNLLNKTLDYNPVNLFPLKETVKRYNSIYGIG